MKALFIGGIKSGKSRNAEQFALMFSKGKPIYLATSEIVDSELNERILKHKELRQNSFSTIEESLKLFDVIAEANEIILLECVSMWINNMLHYKYSDKDIYEQIDAILALEKDIIFIINDVSSSVISDNALVRRFVDINGIIAQKIASKCDEVYHCIAGLASKIK